MSALSERYRGASGNIFVAELYGRRGEVVASIVLRDRELAEQAIHGRWSVHEYAPVGPGEAGEGDPLPESGGFAAWVESGGFAA